MFFSFCALCIWGNVIDARKKDKTVLVIHPKGVVEYYYEGYPKEVRLLYFPHIIQLDIVHRMDVSGVDGDISTNHHYWLDVHKNKGKYFRWYINKVFSEDLMTKRFLAAYKYYRETNTIE